MYAPLKVTTDYSILHSLIKVSDLINFCVHKKIKACAICDTNLFGVIEFYKLATVNNIKPIIGLEITLNNNSIYLYAKNYDGYKNMLKINTIIEEREITLEELKIYHENILIIIPVSNYDILNKLDFFTDKYISYQNEEELKQSLIITEKVVFLNNIKAFRKEDLKYLKYLDKLNDEDEKIYLDNYFNYEKLTNFDLKKITEVVNLLNVEMPNNMRYIPKYNNEIDSYKFLTSLCLKGLNKRLNGKVSNKYLERLKYELSVINKMGFVDYFLIVYDYVLYAKKHNILVGPGRGSAAGSLVSFVIGITDIDPLKYDLLFERFLNYERVTMPDIDIDFENTRREEVIDYVRNKYGKYNVSGGMTFATLKTRLVLKEVGKLLNVDEKLLNKFIKVIDRNSNLKTNLENIKVKEFLKNYQELNNVYDVSLHLEGLKKNISTHAAGIVIADRPLDEIIPMYKNKDVYLTGVAMEYLEDLGLLKMDFLALKNLNTISNIVNKIPNFNLNNIPLDDSKTYELFCNADTDGIFQFETPVFKNMLVKFKPHNFQELVASIALVRPGPSKELETYIRRKNKQEKIDYYHESLKDILSDTYGVIVYQEQVINILVRMANFSYAEADNIRRAMAKKKENILIKYKDEFIKRSVKNNYSENLAINVYEHILKFASYGFNKAHSVSYAYISYEMAYLKTHYNILFTFELLNNSIGNTDDIKNYLNKIKNNNIKIMSTDINNSTNEFTLSNGKIYLPFKLIRNLRSDIIDNILKEREEFGLYKDIFDFFRRTNSFMNKTNYMMLINASALNCFGINIKTLTMNLDSFINYSNLYLELKEYALIPEIEKFTEYSNDILREKEFESYGFYITNHPASKYNNQEVVKLSKIKEYEFKNVILFILVENIRKVKTKKNEDMAFLVGSDETGTSDFTVFPKNYYLLKNIERNDLIKVWGTVTKRYDKTSIVVNNILKE